MNIILEYAISISIYQTLIFIDLLSESQHCRLYDRIA